MMAHTRSHDLAHTRSQDFEYSDLSDVEIDGKDAHRVIGGRKAAQTRKRREGDDVFRKLGHMGGEARKGRRNRNSGHGEHDDDSNSVQSLDSGMRRMDPSGRQGKQQGRRMSRDEDDQDQQRGGRRGSNASYSSGGKRYSRDDDSYDEEERQDSSQKRRRHYDDGKDPVRVRAGRKAAQTRKAHEDEEALRDTSRRSHRRTGESDDESLLDEEDHDRDKSPSRVMAGRKAAETRKAREGEGVFRHKGSMARGHSDEEVSEDEHEHDQTQGGRRQQGQGRRRDRGEGGEGQSRARTKSRGDKDRDRDRDRRREESDHEGDHDRDQDRDKSPSRVVGGRKAAITRRRREGDDVFSKMGHKGAMVRNYGRDMTEALEM